ncbi:MAG: helicase-related protein, partial [Ignavibacteria bacterium]|nr:helicase-related protein [Ignavibacteria bacterium]
YIHSDIDSLESVEILRDLRLGDFDVLVGAKLLREGLDLPEVSLVAIIDADKEGFLRSEKSLLQTAGRTARNVNGKVIMYADKITDSMKKVIDETERRRAKQKEYNRKHKIEPKTIYKTTEEILSATAVADVRKTRDDYGKTTSKFIISSEPILKHLTKEQKEDLIEQLTLEMHNAAKDYEFERAAAIRDEIERLKQTYRLN